MSRCTMIEWPRRIILQCGEHKHTPGVCLFRLKPKRDVESRSAQLDAGLGLYPPYNFLVVILLRPTVIILLNSPLGMIHVQYKH